MVYVTKVKDRNIFVAILYFNILQRRTGMNELFNFNSLTMIILMAIAVIGGFAASIIFYHIIAKEIAKENKTIKEETDDMIKDIREQSDYDVFKLLYKNVKESTGYYVISKRQSAKSFALSLVSCFLGVIIYICGFIIVIVLDKDVVLLTTVSGTIVELIAGLSFWVYNKCINQLNEYHIRLNAIEKYLTSIQMAERLNEDAKEEMYKWIIQNVLKNDANDS